MQHPRFVAGQPPAFSHVLQGNDNLRRVEEPERSIAALPPQEFHQLADRILAQRDARWDEQFDADAD